MDCVLARFDFGCFVLLVDVDPFRVTFFAGKEIEPGESKTADSETEESRNFNFLKAGIGLAETPSPAEEEKALLCAADDDPLEDAAAFWPTALEEANVTECVEPFS